MKQVVHKNKPPRAFYQTTGFVLALVLVILLLIFIVFYWIIKNP